MADFFERATNASNARDVPLASSYVSNTSFPSFAVSGLDLKYPAFQQQSLNTKDLAFPVSVQVLNPEMETCCPALESCCTCFQKSPVLNEGDGRWFRYQHELSKLFFQHRYHLAPGYTRELLAPQMEYMGPLKDRLEDLHAKYQRNFTPIATELHKKKQSANGLAEITSKFQEYSQKLLHAGQAVGFENRDQNYSELNLGINMIHARYREEVLGLIGEWGSRSAQKQEEQLNKFFTKEPWETECKYLMDGIIRVQKGMTGAKMGSTLTSLQNGVGETPSFYIRYDHLDDPAVQGAVDRLVKEFRHSTMLVYELRLIFDEGTAVTDTADTICAKILPLFQTLAEGNVKIELLRICGTLNVPGELLGDYEKVVTRILKTLCGASGMCMSYLERLDLSRNYVDFETLKVLSDLMSTCSCTAINLSYLKLGLLNYPEVIQVPVRDGTCADCTNMCCFTHECDTQRCGRATCICCHKVIDNAQLENEIEKANDRYQQNNKMMLGHHQGGHYLRQIFKSMHARVTGDFKVDVIDLSGTNLPEFCGGAENVAKLFEIIGHCRPTAINLVESGLTDLHAYGLSHLFCKNPFMVHFSASMCASDLESIEILQNLVQNNPLLVSGSLKYSVSSNICVHYPVNHERTTENLCCCIGQPSPCYLIYPCCLKVSKTEHTQDWNKFSVPSHPLTQSDFREYQAVMQRSMHEHRVIPLLTLLMKFANSERKTYKLTHAAIDPNYQLVLSEDADNKKLKLFRDFSTSVGFEFQLEKQLESMCKAIVDRAGGRNAVTDEITSGNYLAVGYSAGETEDIVPYRP